MELLCSVCGRSMRKDTFSDKMVCQRCGNEFGITDEISEGTYEEARAHVRNLRFDQAIKILNGLDKAEPNVMLLNLLCCYQAEDTGVLADKVSKSPEKVKLLLMRKDVNLMAQSDDSRVKDYISHVLEYCFVELALAGVDISDLREKLNAQNTPVRKKPVQKQMSAFAKMDAEENAAAERSRMIREAANPKEKYLDDYVNDFMNTNPSCLDRSLWKEPAGTLAGNIALDIIDLLLMNQQYSPSVMGHTRLYNTQNREAEAEERMREQSGEFKVPDDVARARQKDLLGKLLVEEKSILYKEEK